MNLDLLSWNIHCNDVYSEQGFYTRNSRNWKDALLSVTCMQISYIQRKLSKLKWLMKSSIRLIQTEWYELFNFVKALRFQNTIRCTNKHYFEKPVLTCLLAFLCRTYKTKYRLRSIIIICVWRLKMNGCV